MPTISQLPSLADVTAADAIPVSQNGATHSVSVGALLASAQPAIISELRHIARPRQPRRRRPGAGHRRGRAAAE